MRCLSCYYDLRNLTATSGHRCPECGRVFDPDDPRTWSTRPRRLWPNAAVFLPIVFGIWLFLTTSMFIGEVIAWTEGSYIIALAEAAASAFILTLFISLLLLLGFAFGRRKNPS